MFSILGKDRRHEFYRMFLFTFLCCFVFLAGWSIMFIRQSGLSGLLTPTFIGYGSIFVVSTAMSVAAFYLIAFYKLEKRS